MSINRSAVSAITQAVFLAASPTSSYGTSIDTGMGIVS